MDKGSKNNYFAYFDCNNERMYSAANKDLGVAVNYEEMINDCLIEQATSPTTRIFGYTTFPAVLADGAPAVAYHLAGVSYVARWDGSSWSKSQIPMNPLGYVKTAGGHVILSRSGNTKSVWKSANGISGWSEISNVSIPHENGSNTTMVSGFIDDFRSRAQYLVCTVDSAKRTADYSGKWPVFVYGSAPSGSTPAPTAPTAPSGLMATSISSSQINLSWSDNSSNETGFRIERKTSTNNFTQIATVGANVTAFTNTGLSAATTYVYRIRADNAVGSSMYSNESSASTATQGSSTAPGLIDALVRGGTYAGVNDGESPDLFVKNDSSNFTRETFLRFNVSSLADAESVKLRLVPTGVGSDASTTTLEFAFVSNDAWSETGITWNNKPASSGTPLATVTGNFAVGVPVEVDITASAHSQASGDGLLSVRIRSVTAGSQRYVIFASREHATIGSRPALIAELAPSNLPSAPTGLAAMAVSAAQINLSWTDTSANESGFRIERKTGTSDFVQIATVGANVTTFSSTGLSASTTYTYRVRAYNGNGSSVYSNESSAITVPDEEATSPALPIAAVIASANDGNVAENTIDGNFGTRWSAQGAGQWIRYDLGSPQTVSGANIAWYLGNQRQAYFQIQVSADGSAWTTVLTNGVSSGTTLQGEQHTFDPVSARYVRIVGGGNSSNAWNSITELQILGIPSGSG